MSLSSDQDCPPHIVLLPSSGMGHLMPFLRLAASLMANNVRLTLITAHPTVSLAESQTLSKFSTEFPQVNQQTIEIQPINRSSSSTIDDPFTQRYEAIRNSSQILSPLLLSLSPPVSAVITDMSLTSVVVPITKGLEIPNYIFFTSSAKMLAIYAFYHKIAARIDEEDVIRIPSFEPIPKSWLPLPLLSQGSNLLKTHFIENGEKFVESNGILVNTFEELEKEALTALNSGLVVDHLPPAIAIGPLPPCEFERGEEVLDWLDDQPPRSVLYVCFGTRAAIPRDQIRELGIGLVRSGYKFLWVVKGKTIDREEKEELEDMVGRDIFEKVNQSGLLVKTWMKQEQLLSHGSIGGFLSHCGWNSVTEAMWHGIPILAWPQSADQKINADLLERNKVGIWDKSWGWSGKELVEGEEIKMKVKEMMEDNLLRKQAGEMRNKARTAVGSEGSSKNQLAQVIESLCYRK